MRTVPPALQEHLDSGCTTLTYLLRVAPVTPGFDPLGITLLDRDVEYDDGDGPVSYLAKIGMVPATLQMTSGMDVDNGEIQHLLPEFDLPISEKDIGAGVYDFAEYSLYLVNYADLDAGHVVLAHGQLGQMRTEDGLSFWSEQTALSKRLKASIVQKDSITCRATFGSQYPGSPTGTVFERQPCGFDAESLFVGATVGGVGQESNRTFDAVGLPAGEYVPGMMRWLTGRNAGTENEVEEVDGTTISLTFETKFPIESGDTFDIRPDCTKWKEGANGCKAFFGADWVLHYRGEPYIPIADADAINTPGATVGKGLGG